MATHVFRCYRPGPYPHKGKGVCVCAIYDNNISPSLLMIIIKIIILYFIQIRHTDDFPPTGRPTLLVNDNMTRHHCQLKGELVVSDQYDPFIISDFWYRGLLVIRRHMLLYLNRALSLVAQHNGLPAVSPRGHHRSSSWFTPNFNLVG